MGNWYILPEACRKLGKSRNYLTAKYREKDSMFEGVEIQVLGGIVFVSDNGLELLRQRVKKRGVHQKTRVFSGLEKQENTLLFPPKSILSHIV